MNQRPGMAASWRAVLLGVLKVAGILLAIVAAGAFIVWVWVAF